MAMYSGFDAVNEPQGECDLKTAASWSGLLSRMDLCALQDFVLNISYDYENFQWLVEPLKNGNEKELRRRLLTVLPEKVA